METPTFLDGKAQTTDSDNWQVNCRVARFSEWEKANYKPVAVTKGQPFC